MIESGPIVYSSLSPYVAFLELILLYLVGFGQLIELLSSSLKLFSVLDAVPVFNGELPCVLPDAKSVCLESSYSVYEATGAKFELRSF